MSRHHVPRVRLHPAARLHTAFPQQAFTPPRERLWRTTKKSRKVRILRNGDASALQTAAFSAPP